jgi:hypothetical protein
LNSFICVTCGTQFPPSDTAPALCPICTDERQFVPPAGQAWTTLERLRRSHMTAFRDESGLIGIGTSPGFGIGQRALLIRTPDGNILWDCISVIDPVSVELIKGLGGLCHIAISHPHYYTTMLEWSRAFGDIPIHLHAADRQWVMRDGPAIAYWQGLTKEIAPGLTLIRCGGHFAGGQLLHWAAGAGGKGALMSGDILQVVADGKHLGFMRSYPNYIPLGAAAVRKIAEIVEPWPFEAIYGAFWNRVIPRDAKQALATSIERHIQWVERDLL